MVKIQFLPRLMRSHLEEYEGGKNLWHGWFNAVKVYVVADEDHDRVRIMSPIGEIRRADSAFLKILLRANFDRALDAKYAMRERELWSVCTHPLSTLTPEDVTNFLEQVTRLVHNTGTSYASSELIYGSEEDPTDEETDSPDEDQPEMKDCILPPDAIKRAIDRLID